MHMITFSDLAIILPVAVMLHLTEEFLFPGGFIEWYQELVPSKTKGVRPGYLVWINTLMIGVCILPVYYGNKPIAHNIWFCVAALAAMNALFHVYGVIKLKKYSPGVFTGVLLYIPIFIFGALLLILHQDFPIGKAILFLAMGIGYHVFSVYRQGK